MKIEITEEKIVELLLKCLQDVPAVRNLNYMSNGTDTPHDPVIEVKTERETYRIIFEISNNGQPRYARDAVARLFLKADSYGENVYQVFAAPYISESDFCYQSVQPGH